ncbi:MAG TPA: hypothetical protein VFU41_11035 [Gemmatimonadales bacterium]|nr:hypothetical protein [Gemmatimonadales bacterium]
MRSATPVLVAAHVALLALACRELVAPERPNRETDVPFAIARIAPGTPAARDDSLSLAELSELDREVDALMLKIERNELDVEAMAALAYLYIRRGWFDRAIGPLARAVQVEPAREDLRYELLLAVRLSGLAGQDVDLAEEARRFAEAAAMQGHGC